MKRINHLHAWLSVVCVLLCGCATVNTLEPAHPVAEVTPLDVRRVVTDSALNRRVSVVGVRQATGSQGFLTFQFEVQNRTRKMQSFTYRVDWFDERGLIIRMPTTTAVPRIIEGRQAISISATAPTPLAKDFRVTLMRSLN